MSLIWWSTIATCDIVLLYVIVLSVDIYIVTSVLDPLSPETSLFHRATPGPLDHTLRDTPLDQVGQKYKGTLTEVTVVRGPTLLAQISALWSLAPKGHLSERQQAQ